MPTKAGKLQKPSYTPQWTHDVKQKTKNAKLHHLERN